MSRVVEHLAELTGFRDRDVLDVTLVGALKDLLRPHTVAIYRCVGDAGQQRWLTRARIGPNDTVATADPVWTPLESLPELASQPNRHACLLRQQAFSVPGMPALAYFPLATESEPVGVLEIATRQALALPEHAHGGQHPARLPQLPGACSTTASATRSPACSTARPSTSTS